MVILLNRVLISSFGFDIDFVLKRIATVTGFNRVILLALYTGEDVFRRIEKAYDTLKIVCSSLKIDCILEKINPDKILRHVLTIVKKTVEESESVEVFLTGGPRILVSVIILSLLMLPKHLADRVKIIIEGEGFPCTLEINLSKYQELLKLDNRDLTIVFELQTRGPLQLSSLEENTGIPRSTLYRRLEDLIKKKLVVKEEDKYIAEELFNITCGS